MDLPTLIDGARHSIVQISYTITDLPHERLVELEARGPVWSVPLGTGFVLNNDGCIVTAKHVIDDIASYPTDIPDGTHLVGVGFPYADRDSPGVGARGTFSVWSFDTVARSERHDLALLRPRSNPLAQPDERRRSSTGAAFTPRPVRLATDRPVDGTAVALCGYPLDEASLVSTSGSVASAWSVDLQGTLQMAPDGSYLPVDAADRYLLDVQCNGGNSGGPVVRVHDGAVIGVLVATRLTTISGAKASADLGVAIPSREVARLADETGVAWTSADEDCT